MEKSYTFQKDWYFKKVKALTQRNEILPVSNKKSQTLVYPVKHI